MIKTYVCQFCNGTGTSIEWVVNNGDEMLNDVPCGMCVGTGFPSKIQVNGRPGISDLTIEINSSIVGAQS